MSCSECSATLSASTQSYPETDCFMMSKVYDWVKLKTDQTTMIMIPAADLPAIIAALEAGDSLDVTAAAVLSEATTKVALIERSSDYCACVQFRKRFPVHVIITDETTGEILSDFSKIVQVFDTASLCFPIGMPDSAIQVKIADIKIYSLTTTPVDGAIGFLLSICQDIIVKLDVMVKIKVQDVCSSRAGTQCEGSVSCDPGTPSYPAQCPSASTCG